MKELTKQAIAKTLNEILEKQSIEQITIKKITEQCGINRQTFYYHFCDIYDLIEWSLTKALSDYLLENPFPEGDWNVKVEHVFNFLITKRKIILHGYNHENRNIYEMFIIKMIRPIVTEKFYQCQGSNKLPNDKQEFIIKIHVWLFTALFFEWIENGMTEEFVDKFQDFFILINGSLEASINKFIENK